MQIQPQRQPATEIDASLTGLPAGTLPAEVTSVRHYTDRLFAFRVARPAGLRFRSGEFVMIGLPGGEKPVMRAYSIASPAWDDELEFYSIKVVGGALTDRLQSIVPGDRILLRPKASGTLVLDALLPGKRLWCLSTGTGIAPFASLLRDPETYERYDEVILVQTCRERAELSFAHELVRDACADPLIGDEARSRLSTYFSTTREPSERTGRVTTAIRDGSLFQGRGLKGFNPLNDRVMICGSIGLNTDLRQIMKEFGFSEGSNNTPGEFVVERAFVG